MAEALRIIVSRDGVKGLRRGMLPRVLTVAPSTAISWMSYEFFSASVQLPQSRSRFVLMSHRGVDPPRRGHARDRPGGSPAIKWIDETK
jgi:hypothetical protein